MQQARWLRKLFFHRPYCLPQQLTSCACNAGGRPLQVHTAERRELQAPHR